MKQFESITYLFVIINILISIYCNPIQFKSVCINQHSSNSSLDLSLLEGSWYDLGRTSFVFKENTWRNGFTNVKFDRYLGQIQFDTSGYNRFNKCEIAEPLILNYKNSSNLIHFKSNSNSTGYFRILDFNKEKIQAIVAFCFESDESSEDCIRDQLDIFIWSQNRSSEIANKEELMTIFNKYCVKNESDVVVSDMFDANVCNPTNKIETETEPMLIAELKLTEVLSMLNETNDSFSLNSSILEVPLASLINITSDLSDNNTATLDLVIDLDVLNETTTATTPFNFNLTTANEFSLSSLTNEAQNESISYETQNVTVKDKEIVNQTNFNINITTFLNVTQQNLFTQSPVTTSSLNVTILNQTTLSTEDLSTQFNVTTQISTVPSNYLIFNQTNEKSISLTNENLQHESSNDEKENFSSSVLDDTLLDLNNSLVVQANETETSLEPALIVFKKDKVFFDEKLVNKEVKPHDDEEIKQKVSLISSISTVESLDMKSENVTESINTTMEQVNETEKIIVASTSTIPNNLIDTLDALEKLEIEANKNLTTENIFKNETLAEDMDKDLVLRENNESTEDSNMNETLTTEKAYDKTSEIDDGGDKLTTEYTSNESSASEEINELNTSDVEITTPELSSGKNDEELVEDLNDKNLKESTENAKTEDDEEIIKDEEGDGEDVKKEDFDSLIDEAELDNNEKDENENLNATIESEESEIQIEENSTATLVETTSAEEILTTTPYPCAEKQCPINNCNHGWKKDANNCEMCECLKNSNETASETECTTPYCHPCFYGSFTDENGCDSCACKPRPKPKSIYECPKLDCPSCNYGSIKDEYGCETCICIRPNSLERTYPCPPDPTCPYGSCKYGSVLNEYGCATCDCLKSTEPDREECTRQRCPACPNGYYTDADGCETCSCKPDWMAPCALSELSCDLKKCQYGSYLDRNGCPSCECLPNPDFNIDCKQLAEINPESECDADGAFKVKQCKSQECRCVTKYGIPISDFKASLADSQYMNCECALALYDVSVYKAIGFKLYCAPNGNYETIQCVGGSCACVNEHGDPLGPSVPIYQKHLLRCEGVFQRFYFDQYLTTLAPTTLQQPLCLYHREKALDMRIDDGHLSVPVCDENGLYEPMQCDRNKKYCWCVNIHNGVELYGTKKTGQEPDCNSD